MNLIFENNEGDADDLSQTSSQMAEQAAGAALECKVASEQAASAQVNVDLQLTTSELAAARAQLAKVTSHSMSATNLQTLVPPRVAPWTRTTKDAGCYV